MSWSILKPGLCIKVTSIAAAVLALTKDCGKGMRSTCSGIGAEETEAAAQKEDDLAKGALCGTIPPGDDLNGDSVQNAASTYARRERILILRVGYD